MRQVVGGIVAPNVYIRSTGFHQAHHKPCDLAGEQFDFNSQVKPFGQGYFKSMSRGPEVCGPVVPYLPWVVKARMFRS